MTEPVLHVDHEYSGVHRCLLGRVMSIQAVDDGRQEGAPVPAGTAKASAAAALRSLANGRRPAARRIGARATGRMRSNRVAETRPIDTMDTAVLVIDMQNGFCHPDGSLPSAGLGLPNMPAVIAANADLLATARAAGVR